jgi:4-hydroxy-3-methylbut-2-enyl diphosphate reductase
MKVMLTKQIDFCFGVRRAIRLTEDALKRAKGPVYCLGPLIHNRFEVKRLEGLGLHVIDVAQLKKLKKDASLVIRSHGISPRILTRLKKRNIMLIDCCCPFVKSLQNTVDFLSRKGYSLIIVGDSQHPEVETLIDIAKDRFFVIDKLTDLRPLRSWILRTRRVGIVSQTTQPPQFYYKIILKIFGLLSESSSFALAKIEEFRIHHTICNWTILRQMEAYQLAKKADVMLIVGDHLSANTRKLYAICKDVNKASYHIQDYEEIRPSWIKGKSTVGITSGASTPRYVIDEVVAHLKGRFSCRR